MARRKKGRAIDGVVLLDKPYGESSNRALQKVRRLLNAQKAGHTGSLDPLATGLLPICLGEATKLSAYLLSADKRYRVTADLRYETATGDIEGAPTDHSRVSLPEAQALDEILSRFMGETEQIPPMYSALKVDGKPLYAYARAGEYVERAPRRITVSELTRVAYEPAEHTLTLDVAVSGGTYVRTLVEDIARAWGGRAHVAALRRTGVGALFAAESMTDMARIEGDFAAQDAAAALPSWVRSVSTLLAGWPTRVLEADEAARISMGQTLGGYSSLAEGAICLKSPDGQIIGLGQRKPPNGLAPLRLFSRPLD